MERLHESAKLAKFKKMVIVPEGMHNDTWMKDAQLFKKVEDFSNECLKIKQTTIETSKKED